jgi:acetolactate synthase small subunit
LFEVEVENVNKLLNVLSPSTSRKMNGLSLSSPGIKRKHHDVETINEQISASESKSVRRVNCDKSLSKELVLLFNSKKHKEKMPELVQQTFVYRRSIIDNNDRGFLVLLDDFRFLTDIKNVNYSN